MKKTNDGSLQNDIQTNSVIWQGDLGIEPKNKKQSASHKDEVLKEGGRFFQARQDQE